MPWKSISSTTQLVREERDEEKKGKYIKTQTATVFVLIPHSLVAQQGWFGPDSIMEDMSVNSCHIGAVSHSYRLWDLRQLNPLSNCLTVLICTALLFKIIKLSMLWIMLLSVITIFFIIFLIIPVAILTPRHLC